MTLAAVVALTWVLRWAWMPARFAYASTAATEIGDLRRIDLPDGTIVHVNTDTALTFNFTALERRVSLARGEAFFEVASRRAWPFLVDAGGVSVRAVGTAFNVRYRPDLVEVLVREGRVSVARATAASTNPSAKPRNEDRFVASSRMVKGGEEARVALLAPAAAQRVEVAIVVAPVPRIRVENALAWQQRRLEFADVPLREVVAEFNRYNRHQLVLEDPDLAEQAFGGAFSSTGYASFVEALERSFGVHAERTAERTVLRRKAR